ncbi:hypothetical protein RFI_25732 [Reticulomyxa filosa]|uniref:Uncharacterized protein n=1 Tax=Reticulomyxa filosa TaxID=46433 RepID=X6MCN5_RETFI|nr:hypothetical protein RFI_25732 [Reticulomyxa filosa]|eukprot:ETO11644.1 hypothetical protein RFI_25732 [Reticulomyxa filosa]
MFYKCNRITILDTHETNKPINKSNEKDIQVTNENFFVNVPEAIIAGGRSAFAQYGAQYNSVDLFVIEIDGDFAELLTGSVIPPLFKPNDFCGMVWPHSQIPCFLLLSLLFVYVLVKVQNMVCYS